MARLVKCLEWVAKTLSTSNRTTPSHHTPAHPSANNIRFGHSTFPPHTRSQNYNQRLYCSLEDRRKVYRRRDRHPQIRPQCRRCRSCQDPRRSCSRCGRKRKHPLCKRRLCRCRFRTIGTRSGVLAKGIHLHTGEFETSLVLREIEKSRGCVERLRRKHMLLPQPPQLDESLRILTQVP